MIEAYGTNKVHYTDQNLIMDEENKQQEKQLTLTKDEIGRRFKAFIKEYQSGNIYIYRDQLIGNVAKENYSIEFNFEDINAYDENLADLLIRKPTEVINVVSTIS